MSAFSNALSGQSDQGLSSILAQLNSLLTPTEQLPGAQSPYSVLLAQPGAATRAPPMMAQQTSGAPSPQQGGSLGSLLKSAASPNSPISKLLESLMGPSLASYASGAAANGAVTGALGSVGAQTAPQAASIQAANNAALAASDGGAAGAGAGLLSMGGLSSGLAADSAVTGALGSVGAQTAGEAAAIQAANDAALGGSASGSAAAAAPSALGTAAYAAAGPAAFAAMYGLGNEFNSMLSGQNNNYSIGQINDMLGGVKKNAASTLTPAMASGLAGSLSLTNPNGSPNQGLYGALTQLNQMQLGDFGQATPYVQQQLAGMGFNPVLPAMHGIAAGPSFGPGRSIQRS